MYNIQEIFNSFNPPALSVDQQKAFYSIRKCRTPALGAHLCQCGQCEQETLLYNSCRNRNCPICQGSKQHQWVDKQLAKLLPVGYFHVVFTLPHELNLIILQNQPLLYDILIKTATSTLLELAADKKYLGAQIGITSVLHTWGQNLSFHPHLHCIVPGGGLSADGLSFMKSRKKFFIPVKVISRKFRGKFLHFLREAFQGGKITLVNEASKYLSPAHFSDLLDNLYKTDWVVFTKKPFKSPHHVVKYLGRYTHRVAISNARIKEFDEEHVSFDYKDYRDKSKNKVMKLTGAEFIRRFLLHVLPCGFTKIRHYGILSSRNIKTKLVKCMKLLNWPPMVPPVEICSMRCPSCGSLMEFKSHSDRALVPS